MGSSEGQHRRRRPGRRNVGQRSPQLLHRTGVRCVGGGQAAPERAHVHTWQRRSLGPLVRRCPWQGVIEDIASNIIKIVVNEDFSSGLEAAPVLDYFPYLAPP